MVVLVLVGLVIIGAPFALSMRQAELAAVNYAARTHARLAAMGALNLAKAQLEQSHEFNERGYARAPEVQTVNNSPYVDCWGELRVDMADPAFPFPANPAGAMWSARAEDEQGKVNLKSAPRPLLRNLYLAIFGEGTADRADEVAGKIVSYRNTNPFTSLGQLRADQLGLTELEVQRLTRFLTVHSAPLVGETSSASATLYPININTCSEEALRATLRGIRLRGKLLGVGDDEATLDRDGDGTDETYRDDFEELIRRLRVFARLAGQVADGATIVALDDAARFPLPRQSDPEGEEVDGYWISIAGDAVRYWKKDGGSLSVSANPDYLPTGRVDRAAEAGTEVRLLFADLAHDLGGVLEELVKEGKLTPDSKAAILANAINPFNATVLATDTTTAPLCTQSFNIYTIEATGVMNAPDGRELARYTVRQVAQVAPAGELELRIDTQEDFQSPFYAGLARRLATWPNATQVADVAPRSTEPPEDYVAQRGRLGLLPVEYSPEDPIRFAARFVARFNGPLLDDVLNGGRDGGSGSAWPEPYADLTTVDVQPGDYTDLRPDGLHVGEVKRLVGGVLTPEIRTLVYTARMEGKDAEGKTVQQDNIAHSGDNVVLPIILEMWVKFDAPFDYTQDRTLFDLGHQPYSNRLALLYYGRDSSSGDIVLHACDSTNQPIAAQVRCRVGRDAAPNVVRLIPERWYHVAAIAKGIRYNEMALLINGRSVGRYFPVARVAGSVAMDAASIPCTGTASDDPKGSDDKFVFRHQPWPVAGPAVLGGEVCEYQSVSSNAFSILTDLEGKVVGRGTRNTQARAHADGTRIEIHGYTDHIHKTSHENGLGDTEHLLDNMMDATQEPFLLHDLPAGPLPNGFPEVTVADGDETNPAGAPAPATTTQSGTSQFWDQFSNSYEAWTGVADNTVPSGDWLPIAASEKWIVASETDGGSLADDETQFKAILDDPGFLSMLTWTAQRPTTAKRLVEEPIDGMGFVTLLANPDPIDAEAEREAIKFAKAGIVLVWRYYPGDVDDPETPTDDRRQIAWYIGYIAGFDDPTNYTGYRACFETTKATIVEGAKLRLDCIKLSSNQDLPRGHRGIESIEHRLVGTDQTVTERRERSGRGIFQIVFRDAQNCADPAQPFEWIQFTYPIFPASYVPDDKRKLEDAILAHKFLYGITRCAARTGDADGKPVAFPAAPVSKIMPVFFCSGYIRVLDQDIPLEKGVHDEVTLTDNTGQRENHWVHHGYGNMFAFRESIAPPPAHVFAYINRPRLLKFPSGMPTEPDKLFYLGSDTMYRNGDRKAEATDGPTAGEPERPANATFAEVKVYQAAYGVARLWDCKQTGGAPDPEKHVRNFDGIPAGAAPPFYIRIGNLEDFVPRADPPVAPFRFHHNGHVGSWPLEGYLKIDDEVMFYRVMYRRPRGRHSAPIKFIRPLDDDGNPMPFENDLVTVLDETGTTLYLDLTEEEAEEFPDCGYLTISNAWANLDYWNRIREIMDTYGVDWARIEQDLREGAEVRDADGHIIYSNHHIAHQERVFFRGKRYDTSKNALEITLTHRGILDSTPRKVRMYDPATTGSWFLDPDGSSSNASVSVISVELLILERGCLGTEPEPHVLGSRVNPLDHIQCALAPRTMVKLQRDEAGSLLLDDDGYIKALADDDKAFDIGKPQYEYGIVVEYHDNFPAEGYVQIGNEIIGYAQDRRGGSPVWTAKVPDAAAPGGYKLCEVLTGTKLLRQRFGTPKHTYLTPGGADAVSEVDFMEEEPAYFADAPGTHGRRIVRLREVRYHDRYPISDSGEFTPHRTTSPAGYWEFAYSLPGALWTKVNWTEAKYDDQAGAFVNDKPLDDTDPWDVEVLVQLDNAPAWDDTAIDPATSKPIAQPVLWSDVPGRADVVYDPPGYRLKKPVIYRFDDPAGANHINAASGGAERGQYADRILVRVYFKFNPYSGSDAPNYHFLWRTPWVDTLTLRYKAPTRVLEHREMPY